MVDLGGHTVEAFTDKTKAQNAMDKLNQEDRDAKVVALMTNLNYSLSQANAWVSNWFPYDLYETTLNS